MTAKQATKKQATRRVSRQATKRVCIDVGGTFTDCLVLDESGELTKFKVSTTPKDPSAGFIRSIEKAARHYKLGLGEFLGTVDILIHGTTLATNTLVTGRGAKTAMLTNATASAVGRFAPVPSCQVRRLPSRCFRPAPSSSRATVDLRAPKSARA